MNFIKNKKVIGVLSGLTTLGISSSVTYAAHNSDVVCEPVTKDGSFTFQANGTTTRTEKPLDLLLIVDGSNSIEDDKARMMFKMSVHLLKTLPKDTRVFLTMYTKNKEDSYISQGRHYEAGPLTVEEALSVIEPILSKERIEGYDLMRSIRDNNKSAGVDGSNRPFETFFEQNLRKEAVHSILQITDEWIDYENIDTSFAEWAKANAKTFMSVIMHKDNNTISYRQMQAAGHPNIYVTGGKSQDTINKEVADQFKRTATESVSKPKSRITVTPDVGIALKEVKLVSPDGTEETLPITNNAVNIEKELPKDGNWSVKVKAEGNVPETRKVVSKAFIDEKEVGKNEIVFEPCKPDVRGTDEEKQNVELPYKTIYEDDDTLLMGTKKTKRAGVKGNKEIKKVWETVNGQRKGDPKVTETVTKEAVDEIILVGTLGSVEEKEKIETPYDTRYEDDNTMLEGMRKTKQVGVVGEKEITRVYKTIKGVKKGEPVVTEKVLKNPVDEIIQIGTLGYRYERLTNIVDPNYKFDYYDGTRYGKVTGTTLGHHGLTEITKKYKTIKGVVTGEPEVNTKTVIEKQDTDKKLGTHGKNVYTETFIEPKGVKYVVDATLEEGMELIARPGQDGLKERVSTWETYKGYRRGDAQVTERVIKEKVDMVIRRGTKKKEVPVVKPVVETKPVEVIKPVETLKPVEAPKVVETPKAKEEVKPMVMKPTFAFDTFFKEISDTSNLISRLITRNVNEEKRVSETEDTSKSTTSSNELLDLIKAFIKK